MSIGIVTMEGENYGTILQAYALQQVISQKGTNVYTIHKQPKSQLFLFLRTYIKRKKNVPVLDLQKLENDVRNREKNVKMKVFYQKYICNRSYKTIAAATKGEKDTALFVCGSDQIWNPKFLANPFYYLKFASRDAQWYSYAASLAVDCLSDTEKKEYRSLLSPFQMLSIREKTGYELLSGIFEKEKLRCDVDPILLLDCEEWEKLASKRFANQKYLLVYMLRPMKELLQEAKRLGQQMNLPVLYLGNNDFKMDGITTIRDAGVEDFLSIISNASFVLTNSFHATAFSALFEKQFLSAVISGTGSRVYDFLRELHLEDRILDWNQLEEALRQPIAYCEVKKQIQQKREASLQYLDEIVRKEKGCT